MEIKVRFLVTPVNPESFNRHRLAERNRRRDNPRLLIFTLNKKGEEEWITY